MLIAPALICALAQGDLPLPPERTGLLYISGFVTDNVGEYAPDGSLLRTFEHPDMDQPRGVAVDDYGNLVVVCQGSDRILLMDLNGDVLQQVTHPLLSNPTGLARSADGRWYVGNFQPGRVLVFDEDWSFTTAIDHPSLGLVNCVSFDPDGSLATTDAGGGAVVRFDAQHQFLGTVQHPSLSSPMSIARDSAGNHFVSNGLSSVITRFDAGWNVLGVFGGGVLASPQGIGVDEHDVLTISNFSSNTVHRYDAQGVLLGSFPLVGINTGRNLAWQTSDYALAFDGASRAGDGSPLRVLRVNGGSGDGRGHLSLGVQDSLEVTIVAPPAWQGAPGCVLYASLGVPSLAEIVELPGNLGLMTMAPPFAGGSPTVLMNSIGQAGRFGLGRFPAPGQGASLLSLPTGTGQPMTVTLQALVMDPLAGGLRATNAVVLHLQ